ncbi:MAG: hypothetical protein D6780_01820 [Candidatus Dadabacteria bacterium]|nr:MAG: hypothetical protein D6780_01820 [Candidatus Dadabacteria bacterium]
MSSLTYDEIWKLVPPEEKLEILAKAQARGIISAVIGIILCAALAIGFSLPMLFWISLIGSPLVFQIAASRMWKMLHPQIVLWYLAARSAARRYAFILKSEDLTIKLIFKGELRNLALEEESRDPTAQKWLPVWVVLFRDCLVIIREMPGGAQLEFGGLLGERLKLEPRDDYEDASGIRYKELYLVFNGRDAPPQKVLLRSRYQAAMVALEGFIKQAIEASIKEKEKLEQG